ncbi:uncharacterized protein LOC105210176 isoform X2 [Zeugodacus cucurbitae]|uniref:20S-pre-rRNA D-site endonuclease nob1 n=1 Tax=Zeugodacus cucurbitae TaxID=28588 RepID=A0A0A1XH12_ZEUCU|nr:uncharacterized protein LOC105210176 isoform X2 [Zeugodacus cucurbitae]
MHLFSTLLLIYFTTNTVSAIIVINKVVVRIPKLNDIGLIFDLTVVNSPCKERETLEFRIRSDGTCCINVTENEIMKNAGRVVGGNFGHLEASAAEVVSLIWPTISLYNRVGKCPIVVTSKNARGIEEHHKHTIHFDTRFTTLDPEGHTIRKRPDYKDCKNWDKEYLRNCTPVDCQERYFGKRSFYNKTTEHCDPVPRCDKPNMRYDYYNNECLIPENFFTKEDMKKIQSGDFRNEYEHEEQDTKHNWKKGVNVPPEGKKKKQTSKNLKEEQPQKQQQQQHASAKRETDYCDEDFNFFSQSNIVHPDNSGTNTVPTASVKNDNGYIPYWLKGILEGLVVVLATVAIYVLICFVIFLIVTWISRRQLKCHRETSCILRSPAPSEGTEEPLITPSSLLSQRN